MKWPSFKTVARILAVLVIVLNIQSAQAQTNANTIVWKKLFNRQQTWEWQMLKTLNFNPSNMQVTYDQQRPWANLNPLEKIFGELSLQAAEILAMDLTPGYTAERLVNDIARIPEFKGRVTGILSVLVMGKVMKSSDWESDPNVRALTQWATELYRSMRIRTEYSILKEFQKWKNDWCGYEKVSPEECQALTFGIAELFQRRAVPEALIVKNGMGNVFDKSATGVAMSASLGLAGISATFAVASLTVALGVTVPITTGGATGGLVATSLFAAFGAKAVGAAEATATLAGLGGWAGVAAAPIAAAIMIAVVGTTQGFKEVEAAKIEPMMKMKLGSAISDHTNIRNVLSDTSGRSLFFMAFQQAALNQYTLFMPKVDGELRFFCQAGYVTKYKVDYTYNTAKEGQPAVYKNVETDTKELTVGNEDYVFIPWNATNITVKGYYLSGTWKQFTNSDKSLATTAIKTPTFMCFTSYGTVFEPKFKYDCPEVGNMTTAANALTVTQGGGYVAWITLRYFDKSGKEQTLLNNNSLTLGWSQKFVIPGGAKNITLSIQNMRDGTVIYNHTWPDPPNGCVKIYGTTFDPKWNSECN